MGAPSCSGWKHAQLRRDELHTPTQAVAAGEGRSRVLPAGRSIASQRLGFPDTWGRPSGLDRLFSLLPCYGLNYVPQIPNPQYPRMQSYLEAAPLQAS